ncbi:MAG: hypothetical protein VR73_14695 [Gammaproteobacteria bacterium BRH_c0]|nr:MAG: hypothetical protein VR73_14695 [Gammaproteobacteria bacterium BRH_c0]
MANESVHQLQPGRPLRSDAGGLVGHNIKQSLENIANAAALLSAVDLSDLPDGAELGTHHLLMQIYDACQYEAEQVGGAA